MPHPQLRRVALAAISIAFIARSADAGHHAAIGVVGEQNHATPIVGFYEASEACVEACAPFLVEGINHEERPLFEQCVSRHRCQPLIDRPPSPQPEHCGSDHRIADEADFQAVCVPWSGLEGIADDAERFSQRSCCLQFEIAKKGWRGWQLEYGPYEMSTQVNDEFTVGWAQVPNGEALDAEQSSYEYMVGFEFWQYSGSHHFIMSDVLGSYNDPQRARGCAERSGEDRARCEAFENLGQSCPATADEDPNGRNFGKPSDGKDYGPDGNRTRSSGSCSNAPGHRTFPLAGSPGPAYFPVPYPDGVGIKISREHMFQMTHHLQNWYNAAAGVALDPTNPATQVAQVWVNIYTMPAKAPGGGESVEREAHVFFDGSGAALYHPPFAVTPAQGLWVAPRDILLYGMTAHSHKRNTLFTADLIGVDGEVKTLPVRAYDHSHPVCGGFARVRDDEGQPTGDVIRDEPPMHLYESTDWSDHENCYWWLEDGTTAGDAAILVKQGEGIRYNCLVNNGFLPVQITKHSGLPPRTGDAGVDQIASNARGGALANLGRIPAGVLAHQSVPVEAHDAFGNPVRVKYSCEEIEGVRPGVPGAGAVGLYEVAPCLPDAIKDVPVGAEFSDPALVSVALDGGPAVECDPQGSWRHFRRYSGYDNPFLGQPVVGGLFEGKFTGKCVPSPIGFSETEDDEMCILLGLYAFAGADALPTSSEGPLGDNGVDRLPTDVGR